MMRKSVNYLDLLFNGPQNLMQLFAILLKIIPISLLEEYSLLDGYNILSLYLCIKLNKKLRVFKGNFELR